MIGKYSSLACSNTVYITSYYEGIAYYYVMVKSGNSITTNLLMEQPTEQKNGVEISIRNISNTNAYIKALQCIIFFPNIYIDGFYDKDRLNNIKLKRFKHFAAASIRVSHKLLLGNVLYPVNTNLLNNEANNFINELYNTGIVIKFDVGEIDITPNRESIIYSSDTIKKIEKRIKDAKSELETLIELKISKDYDNIIDYFNAITKTRYYDPVTDKITDNYTGYKIDLLKLCTTSITYKNTDLKSYGNIIRNILHSKIPGFKAVIDNKVYTKKLPYQLRDYDTFMAPVIIKLKGTKLFDYIKAYIKTTYNSCCVITDITKEEFKKWIDYSMPYFTGPNKELIIDGIYQDTIEKAIEIDINDDDLIDYKKEFLANRHTDTYDIGDTILYLWGCNSYRRKRNFNNFQEAVNFIKSLKTGVLLANMNADDILLSSIASKRGFVYIKAKKDVVNKLKSINLKCIVDIDWVTTKDRVLSTMKTIIKHFPEGINGYDVTEIFSIINKDEGKEFMELYNTYSLYYSNAYRYIIEQTDIPYDSYTEYLCLKLKKYLEAHHSIKQIVDTIDSSSRVLKIAAIIKTKAYRISNDAYIEFKNNKLLNILCRK